MHELELELEACKQDVARERTKVEEREEAVAKHTAAVLEREKERLADLGRRVESRADKMQRELEINAAERSIRYKEAVDEKKCS